MANEERAPRAQWAALGPDEHVAPSGGAERPLTAPGTASDARGAEGEADGEGGRLTVTNFQRQLSILVDNTRLRRLVNNLEVAGRYADMRRLQELRDPSVDHSWVRRLDFVDGPVMREEDYALALQLRLGANIVADSYECPECGRLVDTHLSHSSCCAKAERTKRHYAVVRAMFDRISAVDRGAVLEQRGLVEAEPGARPGDIFTTAAVPNRDAALDVTVVSQEAAGSGADCVATAHAGKFHRYRAAVAEWGSSGISLQPLVWSNEGRAHPDVGRVMDFTAAAIARRVGQSTQAVLRRWKADVGVALAVRRARMARRCLPTKTARDGFVQCGEVGEGDGGRREAEGELGRYLAGEEEDWGGEPAAGSTGAQ